MNDFNASLHLKSLSNIPDSEIDLGLTALALSAVEFPDKYISHFKKLQDSVLSRHKALLENGGDDDGRTQLAALKHILSDEHDYRLEAEVIEILESVDIARVIDRRLGISNALCILYIHTAQHIGWGIEALSFPGGMLCRLEKDGQRLIFDAARQCRLLAAPELREMVKTALGPNAELSAAYFEPLTNREILIRLQNNVKLRYIEMGEYKKALSAVEKMLLIHPEEYRLFLDAGVLYAKTHQSLRAIQYLEKYISKTQNGKDRQEAILLLNEIREGLVV